MKILLAQPALLRFQWELEVLLVNLRQFGDLEVVLLFAGNNFTIPAYFRKHYPECEVFMYEDRREDRYQPDEYKPAVRPYLWWQHLDAHPEAENETYFYLDSDIIFRSWPNLKTLMVTPKTWAGSDCSHYIDYNYLKKCVGGPTIAERMAEITGITLEQLQAVPGAGAQWLIENPTAAYWKRVYDDSLAIHRYFQTVNTDLQKWTAEMWAQLYGMVREGVTVKIDKELDFCRPTDPIEVYDTVKILHNAGVMNDSEMFYKGKYVQETPFGKNLDYVNPAKASRKYVEAIEKVVKLRA